MIICWGSEVWLSEISVGSLFFSDTTICKLGLWLLPPISISPRKGAQCSLDLPGVVEKALAGLPSGFSVSLEGHLLSFSGPFSVLGV